MLTPGQSSRDLSTPVPFQLPGEHTNTASVAALEIASDTLSSLSYQVHIHTWVARSTRRWSTLPNDTTWKQRCPSAERRWGGGPGAVAKSCLLGKSEIVGLNPTQRNQNVSSPVTREDSILWGPQWPTGSVLGLRPLEFRILCLDGSVISFISPFPGSSPDPV